MRAAVDLLGVLTEVVMLYYLYENILTRKDKARWQVYGVYVLVGVFFYADFNLCCSAQSALR